MSVRALLAAALLSACGEAPPATAILPAPAAAPAPAPSPAPAAAPMVGVLVPEAEVVLVSSGFSRLARLDLEVGDHVNEGDVVAAMDVRGDRSELAVATAAWQASTAELERLALELERAKMTRADVEQLEDYVSRAELREQRYAEKLAAARKRSAGASQSQQRSKMDEATARIAESELRAPFAGVIASRHVDAGATLGAGEPVVRLISDARVLRFAVPEARSHALRLGAPVTVTFADAPPLTGEVITVAPEIEVGTRLIFAEARLTGSETAASLRIGTVAQVRFAGE
ncbi:efflux RND transporter periplasmic adaptor subunit [Nannocystis radixulma]|uniref:HlyD family efflux transporter periplasmic adaptor subunit n=1 Tax=Nannocystis radixulma TaxID=2995305 RepID=A0ABT5BI10_9BACT|nr:HlyD family efflux transporter periplasmic adaptor subunit [Nannocystis radixulma]MDC0672606.1 HlyD family efflux transporter periplasmic adaptor subunit [Nannocystis radixulma]